jgi:hypothetical protein
MHKTGTIYITFEEGYLRIISVKFGQNLLMGLGEDVV